MGCSKEGIMDQIFGVFASSGKAIGKTIQRSMMLLDPFLPNCLGTRHTCELPPRGQHTLGCAQVLFYSRSKEKRRKNTRQNLIAKISPDRE